MIKLENVRKQFGEQVVLNDVSFTLGTNEVVGLIGENGSGKTTLLKMLTGELKPDDGNIMIQQEVIGYIPQHTNFADGITVESFLSGKVTPDEMYKVDVALAQVGLTHLSRNQRATLLSGGQKTRLYIASLLVSDPEPTTLLLDEPTNNLDVEGIAWLEEFIASFPGNILLVSHDRTLLDNVGEKIIELRDGAINVYGGNYSFYREQLEIELQAKERMYAVQQKKIKKIAEDIEKTQQRARQGEIQFGSNMPYQRRKIMKSAQQAVHRKRRLEKLLTSNQLLEKPESAIRHFINLSAKTHSGKTLMFVRNLSKSYDNHTVINNVSFHIAGNERVWLAGLNGSGKSTLMKILMGEVANDEGSIEVGENVSVGYFSQDRQDLATYSTILDEFNKIGLTQTESYKLAVSFGFAKNELQKKIGELSVGQKAKVAIAKLTAGKYQLVLLDEPTNHLEIATREILEKALNRYEGGILVSSHDRFFLEQIGINKTVSLPTP